MSWLIVSSNKSPHPVLAVFGILVGILAGVVGIYGTWYAVKHSGAATAVKADNPHNSMDSRSAALVPTSPPHITKPTVPDIAKPSSNSSVDSGSLQNVYQHPEELSASQEQVHKFDRVELSDCSSPDLDLHFKAYALSPNNGAPGITDVELRVTNKGVLAVGLTQVGPAYLTDSSSLRIPSTSSDVPYVSGFRFISPLQQPSNVAKIAAGTDQIFTIHFKDPSIVEAGVSSVDLTIILRSHGELDEMDAGVRVPVHPQNIHCQKSSSSM